MMPPRSAPNDIGISSEDRDVLVRCARLKGDRHQHGERADILDEGREQRDRPDKRNDLSVDCQ
jgi:hypothetical protein